MSFVGRLVLALFILGHLAALCVSLVSLWRLRRPGAVADDERLARTPYRSLPAPLTLSWWARLRAWAWRGRERRERLDHERRAWVERLERLDQHARESRCDDMCAVRHAMCAARLEAMELRLEAFEKKAAEKVGW
jgi:hypothetical protein